MQLKLIEMQYRCTILPMKMSTKDPFGNASFREFVSDVRKTIIMNILKISAVLLATLIVIYFDSNGTFVYHTATLNLKVISLFVLTAIASLYLIYYIIVSIPQIIYLSRLLKSEYVSAVDTGVTGTFFAVKDEKEELIRFLSNDRFLIIADEEEAKLELFDLSRNVDTFIERREKQSTKNNSLPEWFVEVSGGNSLRNKAAIKFHFLSTDDSYYIIEDIRKVSNQVRFGEIASVKREEHDLLKKALGEDFKF